MGKRAEDKSGKWFGDYFIIDRNYDKQYTAAHYNYKCKCGETGVIDVRSIKDNICCRHYLVCKVCGKPASEDSHFYPAQQLCNRHYLQIVRHGDILAVEKMKTFGIIRKCDICGDTHYDRYYVWQKDGEMHGKTLCGKHYNQMCSKNKITDPTPSEHLPRKKWTKEEEGELRDMWLKEIPVSQLAQYFGATECAVSSKAFDIGVSKEIVKPNNPKFKAVYQDYDWCFERFINRGMSMKEMAEEAGASLRVIQKWCQEVHDLDARSYKKYKTISEKQRQLIMFGLLGDGHIDRREDQPMYIESHAENQKDYLYWKWSVLKDLCNKEPIYYPPSEHTFENDKKYKCQAHYRLCTRIIDALKPIREMTKLEIIDQLNEFGLSLYMLDDASCSNGYWEICVASLTIEEKGKFLKVLQERFQIVGRIRKDVRYIGFGKSNSEIISQIILKTVPNDLDIVQRKILKDTGLN